MTQRGFDRLAIVVRSHMVAEMEYERREDLRSEGKRVCLVLRSQESKLGVVRIGIQDEEAHLRLYRGVKNVTVGLHLLQYG